MDRGHSFFFDFRLVTDQVYIGSADWGDSYYGFRGYLDNVHLKLGGGDLPDPTLRPPEEYDFPASELTFLRNLSLASVGSDVFGSVVTSSSVTFDAPTANGTALFALTTDKPVHSFRARFAGTPAFKLEVYRDDELVSGASDESTTTSDSTTDKTHRVTHFVGVQGAGLAPAVTEMRVHYGGTRVVAGPLDHRELVDIVAVSRASESFVQPGDLSGGDYFSNGAGAIDVDGDTMVVGSWRQLGGAASGAAYVFVRHNGAWFQTAKLLATVPPNGIASRANIQSGAGGEWGSWHFYYVNTDADGNDIYELSKIGNYGYTAAHNLKYVRSTKTWTSGGSKTYQFVHEDGVIKLYLPSGDMPGSYSGTVFLGIFIDPYETLGSEVSGDAYFGSTVAVHGNTIVVGSPSQEGGWKGVAYVFVKDEPENPLSSWSVVDKLRYSDSPSNDFFAWRGLSLHGDTIVAGAHAYGEPDRGAAFVFTRSVPGALNSTWSLQQTIETAEVGTGLRVLVHDNELFVLDGSAVHTFTRTSFGESFVPEASIAGVFEVMAFDGSTLVLGNKNHETQKGEAFAYARTGPGTFGSATELVPDDTLTNYDYFGGDVAVAGSKIVVGSAGRDDGASGKGAAYVFEKSGATWSQTRRLSPDVMTADSNYGDSVAMNDRHLAVGAYGYEAQKGAVMTESAASTSEDSDLATMFDGLIEFHPSTALVFDASPSNALLFYVQLPKNVVPLSTEIWTRGLSNPSLVFATDLDIATRKYEYIVFAGFSTTSTSPSIEELELTLDDAGNKIAYGSTSMVAAYNTFNTDTVKFYTGQTFNGAKMFDSTKCYSRSQQEWWTANDVWAKSPTTIYPLFYIQLTAPLRPISGKAWTGFYSYPGDHFDRIAIYGTNDEPDSTSDSLDSFDYLVDLSVRSQSHSHGGCPGADVYMPVPPGVDTFTLPSSAWSPLESELVAHEAPDVPSPPPPPLLPSPPPLLPSPPPPPVERFEFIIKSADRSNAGFTELDIFYSEGAPEHVYTAADFYEMSLSSGSILAGSKDATPYVELTDNATSGDLAVVYYRSITTLYRF